MTNNEDQRAAFYIPGRIILFAKICFDALALFCLMTFLLN
jgi:hypothetical protein